MNQKKGVTIISDKPEDEEIVGVHTGLHASGIYLEEGINTSIRRNYCANCKRNIHCYVKVDKETHEAVVHNTCKDKICECKCKTHYACKNCGYLHPYGTQCNKIESEYIPNPKNEEQFMELMEGWRKSQK